MEILGISVDDDKNAWEKSLEAEKLPWLHVRDEKHSGGRTYGKCLVRCGRYSALRVDRSGGKVGCLRVFLFGRNWKRWLMSYWINREK